MNDLEKLINSFISKNKRYVCLYDTREDMFNELFLEVWSRLDKYDSSKSKLSTFVYLLCKRKIASDIRSGKFNFISNENFLEDQSTDTSDWEDMFVDDFDLEKYLENKYIYDSVYPLLSNEAKLYLDGMSVKDIAKINNTSELIVYKRINDCFNILKYIKYENFNTTMIKSLSKVMSIMNERHCSFKQAKRILNKENRRGYC